MIKKKKKLPKYQWAGATGDTNQLYDPNAPLPIYANPSENTVRASSMGNNQPYGALGYSGGFQALNTGLDVVRGIAGQVNDIKNSNLEQQKLQRTRYDRNSYNPYENGFNQVNEYYQVGGGDNPTPPPAPPPTNQYQVNNAGRTAWNNYVGWLKKKGLAGSPTLDKNGLGKQLLTQYMKEVPNSGLTPDNVVPIQKDFTNYRTYALNQIHHKLATTTASSDDAFMANLSKIDGYPGSKTTSVVFPDAYLKQYNDGQLVSNTNLGYSTPGMNFQNGGGLSADKAKEILRDGTAQGHKLTDKQKKYFGYIAGGGKPELQIGGQLDSVVPNLATFVKDKNVNRNSKNYKLLSGLNPNASNFDDQAQQALETFTKKSNKGDNEANKYGLLLQEYMSYKDQLSNDEFDAPTNFKPDFYKNGGGIHIKKSHEGEFKAYAKSKGMSVQQAAHHVMAHSKDSKLRKQANFALNAAHWKKQNGGNMVNNTGYLPGYDTANNPYNIIPSNDITMNGVPHDIMAYPNVGQPVLMKQNGGKYTFPNADYVTEYPMYQDGGQDPNQQQDPSQQQQIPDQQNQIQQIIQAYAQLTGQDPQAIIKQLQSLPQDQQGQAIQKMVQAIQQAQQQGGGQQQDPSQQQAPQQQMQQGGTPQVGSVPNGQANSELEQGEVFKDQQGAIKKVAESQPRHEDGGSPQNNVARVLEDTADKRTDPDSKTLRISPAEAFAMTGFKPKGNLTHSKLYEQATEYYDSRLQSMQKNLQNNLDYVKYNNGGKYAENSLDENLRILQELPTKGQLFDDIYNHQEDVKRKYNISQEQQKMQKGGIPKYQNGKTEDPSNIDPQSYDPSKHGGLSYDQLVENWEKAQNYQGTGISPRSPSKGTVQQPIYNSQFLGLKPLIPKYYRNDASSEQRPDLQLQQGNTFGNLNKYNLPQFIEANPWAKQFVGQHGEKLTSDNVKAMQGYYDNYMKNNYNTPYFTNKSAGVDAKFGQETAGLAPVYAGTINYDNPTDLANKTKNYIFDKEDNAYLDKNNPIYYDIAQNPQKAGAPPADAQYTRPNGTKASNFNEPLHWYDIAGDVNSYLSAEDRTPVPLEQLHRPPIRAHELDPLPTLLKNQGDYNAALQQLPQSGVGFANQANLLGNKYKVNNEVLGQYENANKEKLDRVDEINNNNQYQLDQTNLGLRDQFNNRILQGKEVQREQKLESLNNFYDKVAQNAAFNRNGNLLLKMTPYFDQNGNFNGNQYTLKNNSANGQDIIDKKTGKVVDTLDGQGNLKSQRITYK